MVDERNNSFSSTLGSFLQRNGSSGMYVRRYVDHMIQAREFGWSFPVNMRIFRPSN